MKKLLLLFISILCLFSLLLCSCKAEKDSDNSSSSSSKTASASSIEESETTEEAELTDKTVKFQELDISQIKDEQLITTNSSASFRYPGVTFEDLFEYSDYIVRGTVKNRYYTIIENLSYTIVDFAVTESISGSIEKDSVITVIYLGGYMSVADKIKFDGDDSKFKAVPEKDRETTFIKISFGGFEPPQQDGEYLLCLCDDFYIKGAYCSLNSFEGTFKYSDGKYTRFEPGEGYFGDSEKEGETRLEDNVSFKMDNFKTRLNKYKSTAKK